MAKEEIVKKWFNRAEKDIEDAEFLFKHKRNKENILFLIHQGVEKYLKGFLLYNGWKLEKTHDLVKLLQAAIRFYKRFEEYLDSLEKLTKRYIEVRYPFVFEREYSNKELNELLQVAKKITNIIKGKIKL